MNIFELLPPHVADYLLKFVGVDAVVRHHFTMQVLPLLNRAPALVGSTESGGCTDCYFEGLRLQLPFASCDACVGGSQFEMIFYEDFAKSIAAFCNARPWDGEVHDRRLALCGPEVAKVAFQDVEPGAVGVHHQKRDLMMELWFEANNVMSKLMWMTENAIVARLLATSTCF